MWSSERSISGTASITLDSALAEKDILIGQLKAKLDKAETEKALAVSVAVQEKEKELSEKGTEITRLRGDLELQKQKSALDTAALVKQHKDELQVREDEIERLKDFKARLSTKWWARAWSSTV